MPILSTRGSGSISGFGKREKSNSLHWNTTFNLGLDYEGVAVNKQLTATGNGVISYEFISGSIPPGIFFNRFTGEFSGTGTIGAVPDYQSAIYTFTLSATDATSTINGTFTYTISSRYVGYVCATVNEGGTITVTAPTGFVFLRRDFSSYGNPTGTCGAFVLGGCNSVSSNSWNGPIGLNSASTQASNGIWGDPCDGTAKRMYVQFTYGLP
jgi:hypothetical protein